jgi:hypothetical protein
MWCRHCQQDVPVLRSERGAPACPRCRAALRGAAGEAGIELASMDRPVVAPSECSTLLAVDPAVADLRRISRKLRPTPYARMTVGHSPALSHSPTAETNHDLADAAASLPRSRPAESPEPTPVLWAPTLTLAAGFALLAGAIAAVAAHAAGQASVEVWRWGLVAALSGEGLLVAGFAWLASRLWRNSRRLNRRLDAVERQLAGQAAEHRAAGEHWRHASGTLPFSSRAA